MYDLSFLNVLSVVGFSVTIFGIVGSILGIGFCLTLLLIGFFLLVFINKRKPSFLSKKLIAIGATGLFAFVGILLAISAVVILLLIVFVFRLVPTTVDQFDQIRKISNKVQSLKISKQGNLPGEKEVLSFLETIKDGNQYAYTLINKNDYKIVSSGLDSIVGNNNDIEFLFSIHGEEKKIRTP